MGTKINHLFEYLYIVMAAMSVYVVITSWTIDRNRAYLFIVFSIVAILMFFFKRNFRKKIEERNNQK
ncbi:MAG: hypothetical protein QM499_03745 [Flavobacteriaceae bacterium]